MEGGDRAIGKARARRPSKIGDFRRDASFGANESEDAHQSISRLKRHLQGQKLKTLEM